MSNNILTKIEGVYPLERIVTKKGKIPVWPLLRQKVYYRHLAKTVQYSSKKRTRSPRLLVRNFFYGWPQLFKLFKYEYYCFENTNKRIDHNGKWFDIYFDAWADRLGSDKALFVEFAARDYYLRSTVHSKNIISDLPFKLLGWLFSLTASTRLEDQELLDKICLENQLDFDISKELKNTLGAYYAYRWLFKKCNRIKAVFVLSSFSKVPMVMAARSLDIRVIEAQHGYIGHQHPFYSAKSQFKEAYPDMLLSFGTYEKEHGQDFIYDHKAILPTGSLHLQTEKSKPAPSVLQALKDQFETIVCLTMQDIKELEFLRMTEDLAKNNKEVLFIICPKNRANDYSDYLNHDNYILSEGSIYDVLKISDFNITIFSTTAVEGEFLGAKTIFYNAGGFSRSYFKTDTFDAVVLEEEDQLRMEHLKLDGPVRSSYFENDYFNKVNKIDLQELLGQ